MAYMQHVVYDNHIDYLRNYAVGNTDRSHCRQCFKHREKIWKEFPFIKKMCSYMYDLHTCTCV